MNWPRTLGRAWSAALLAIAVLALAAACGGDSEPEETASPAATATQPTATPTATPTPTPEPTADELLASTSENLIAASTIKLAMVDELESGAQFFGTTFKSMEAELRNPDSFRMVVAVVAPGLGFVEIEMMAVGEQAFMKFAKDSPWTPLPLDQVPFNFVSIGTTLSGILSGMTDAAITGREDVDGTAAIVVQGGVTSDAMSALVTGADPGNAIALTLWIGEAEHELLRMRFAGQLYNDDAPETTRLLIISGIDVPVDIQLPDIASGS